MSVKDGSPEHEYILGITEAAELRSNSLSFMVEHGVSRAWEFRW